jgi:transcriptional regulator with XRE-family HTH domain
MKAQGYLQSLLRNFQNLRERSGVSERELEERLILGPGWIRRFETGETVPTIDMLLAMLHEIGATLEELFRDMPAPEAAEVDRLIHAEQDGRDLIIYFRYAKFDSRYVLNNATVDEFEVVLKTLRDRLAQVVTVDERLREAIKTDAVATSFLTAVRIWPHANPSDLWWFLVYRAYCDPYNHPSRFARMDLTQSWKRTGGWALEEVVVRHYGPFLKSRDVNIFIGSTSEKRAIVEALAVGDRIEADKIDVILSGTQKAKERFFGVVHVKSSFAERRTDDVPMSAALIRNGFTSPLWTMDCKSTPGVSPVNRGELGAALSRRRSAKRKDIEDEGYFSGCFSYNRNTIPSSDQLPPERRVYICDFTNPDDSFSQFILRRWQTFQTD